MRRLLQHASVTRYVIAQRAWIDIRSAELDSVADQPAFHAVRIGFDVKLESQKIGAFSEGLHRAKAGESESFATLADRDYRHASSVPERLQGDAAA